jgi:hypothetical protein
MTGPELDKLTDALHDTIARHNADENESVQTLIRVIADLVMRFGENPAPRIAAVKQQLSSVIRERQQCLREIERIFGV